MRWMRLSVFLLPLTMAVACDDSTGNDNSGQARVFMSVSGNTSAAVVSASADYVANAMGSLSLDDVDSLFVHLTAISLLRLGADSADTSGGWVTIELSDSGSVPINVLNLPEQDSVLMAQGALEAGDYKNLRLQFDSASIVLKNDVTVGGYSFQKDSTYTLRVPSGVIKVPLPKFTIGADSVSTLDLEFQEHPSIANIVATGSGVLQMTPVLHVK